MISNVTNVTILDTWIKIAYFDVLERNSHKIRMNKYGKRRLKSVFSLSRLKETKMFGMSIVVSQHI